VLGLLVIYRSLVVLGVAAYEKLPSGDEDQLGLEQLFGMEYSPIAYGGRAVDVSRRAVWQRILADQWSGSNQAVWTL
jgi:hypothetical protein